MKSELATVNLETGEIIQHDPAKAAINIYQSDILMERAKTARDPEKFADAISTNLQAKRDFAAAYRAKYPASQSTGGKQPGAGTCVRISPAEFCRSYGFALRTVQSWGERLLDDASFQAEIEAAIEKIKAMFLEIDKGNTTAKKWTGDAESYTPSDYVKSSRAVLGGIDLDPASNEVAQKVVKAKEYFTIDSDGLKQSWHGRVFLNPPYKHPTIAEFINKLCDEYENGNVPAAILLTNNNTDTKWWHKAAKTASAVCFTAGRINFYKADGRETQPTNGQTFFFFGSTFAVEKFKEEFSKHGLVMKSGD